MNEFCVQNNECMNSVRQRTGEYYDRAEQKELSSVTYSDKKAEFHRFF